MPLPLIVLAVVALFGTVNRLSHRTEFIRDNQAWALKQFPGSKPLTQRELYVACLDGSTICDIAPEIEKAHRAAE